MYLDPMDVRGQIRSLSRLVRFHWLLSVHRSRDPHRSGVSFGFGVFLGFLPMGALATVLAFFVSRKTGLPAPPAIAGTFTGNWFTAPFIYAASWWTGKLLTTGRIPGAQVPAQTVDKSDGWREAVLSFLAQGPSFMLGIVVVSLLAGLVGYVVIRNAVIQVRKIRHLRYARHIERMGHPG